MQETKEQQLFFMRWAIGLGQKGRISAPPNPWVGCVIVQDGQIRGEGYHEKAGKEHAEVMAIRNAGAFANRATAYISLEPCSHQGRTPPCVHALIESGIQKVVIPFLDPDPNVAGKGIEKLKHAGIEVEVGLCREEAELALKPYLYHRRTKKPFTILKAAMSLDGRTAAADGSSQWITEESARQNVQLVRAQSQAILIGSQTALLDSPRLTVREIALEKQPMRVLIDSTGKVPATGPLADQSLAPTLVFTTHPQKQWEACGAEVIVKEKIVLEEILEELGKRNVIQLLIEGGSRMHAAFLEKKLANQFILYIGGCLLGDQGQPLVPNFFVPSITQAPHWKLEDVTRFGNDVRLDYTL